MENRTWLNRVKTLPKSWVVGLLLALSTFLGIYGLHGDVVLHPNSHLLSSAGEGARVYYVLASHAKQDSSYLNFQGMNAPYGEHLVYCDAQPIVANAFKTLTSIAPRAKSYAVGFQNSLSLYAFLLASLLLYVFFLRWKVPAWYAAIAALAVVLIGPQVSRLPWQPGLAYPFVIPLLLVLLQSYLRKPKWSLCIWIAFALLGLFFINPYLGVMGSGMFLVAGAMLWLKSNWKNLKTPLQVAVQAMLPGIVYYAFVAFTDGRTDRVQVPTGFTDFTSQLNTVFSATRTPFAGLYESIGIDAADVNIHEEGWAYVGISVTILLLLFAVLRLRSILTKKALNLGVGKEQKIVLGVSVVFLVIALGFPFTLHESFESLLDLFPPFRQLRAPGRMAWMFAYGINVLSFYLFYQLIQNHLPKAHQWKGFAVAVLLMGVTIYEGTYLHAGISKFAVPENPFDMAQLPQNPEVAYMADALAAVDFTPYSAIVPLPYYHVGSEVFVAKTNASYRSMLESITLAYHSGLPLTGAYLSRISKTESRNSLQFFSSELLEKEIAKDLPLDRSLLLCYGKKNQVLSDEEKRILNLGTVVYESPFILLAEVWPRDIFKTQTAAFLSDFQSYKSSYQQKENCYFLPNKDFLHLSYDEQNTAKGIAGNGLEISADALHYLFDGSQHIDALPNGNYELSFWFEHSENRAQSKLMQETVDYKTGNVLEKIELPKAKRTFDFWGDWMRWSVPIEMKEATFVRLYLECPSGIEHLVIDELLVIPTEISIFIEVDGEKWTWNNVPLYAPNKEE